MRAKVKPQKVMLLHFGADRTVKVAKAVKFKNDIILYDRYAYLRGYNATDAFRMYVRSRLKRDGNGNVDVEDVYRDYFDFCNEYGLPILPVEKFVEKLEDLTTIRNGKVEGVTFDEKRIKINSDSDIYLYETGKLRKKKVPVYVTMEGVPTTITFDTLKAYALNGDHELVTFDDETLASVISESTTMGATLGTQKLFWDIKILVIMAIILSFISLYLGFQNHLMLDKVVKMLGRIV